MGAGMRVSFTAESKSLLRLSTSWETFAFCRENLQRFCRAGSHLSGGRWAGGCHLCDVFWRRTHPVYRGVIGAGGAEMRVSFSAESKNLPRLSTLWEAFEKSGLSERKSPLFLFAFGFELAT